MRQLTEKDFDSYLEHLNNKQAIILWLISTHESCIDAYDLLKSIPFNKNLVELSVVDIDKDPKLAMRVSIRKAPFITVYSRKRVVSSGFFNPITQKALMDIVGKQAYETFTSNI